jgi:hypothetical protein
MGTACEVPGIAPVLVDSNPRSGKAFARAQVLDLGLRASVCAPGDGGF